MLFSAGEPSMRLTLKNLVFAFVTVTTATSFAERSRAYVPFSFVVKAQVFPAGFYDVSLNQPQSFITLVSEKDSAKFITMATGATQKRDAETVLQFGAVGTDHCLKTVQMGSRLSPNLTCHNPSNGGALVKGY
jgi:hypothetical protein